MKTGLHPEYIKTTVHCNGCNTTFETRSTTGSITVEICSNCHPFYTGKQKLVDTAGRVDKFNARRRAASQIQSKTTPKKSDPGLAKLEKELTKETIDLKPASDKL